MNRAKAKPFGVRGSARGVSDKIAFLALLGVVYLGFYAFMVWIAVVVDVSDKVAVISMNTPFLIGVAGLLIASYQRRKLLVPSLCALGVIVLLMFVEALYIEYHLRSCISLLASSESSPAIRQKWDAIRALGRTSDRRAVATLVGVLRNPESVFRKDAARALAGRSSTEAISVLTDSLRDPEDELRAAAAESLSKTLREYSDAAAERSLLEIAGHGDLAVVNGAYLFLVGSGRQELEPLLVRALLDYPASWQMAVDYLNSGNPNLSEAAKAWAAKHSYKITSRSGGPRVKWGMQHP
jgi:hypothetical protein